MLVLAAHIPHVGVSVNGAQRWIGRGPLQFEPSELMKLALVLYVATLLAKRPRSVHDLRELARPLLLVVGAACLLVFTQPDLGTAMVIAFTVAAMLIAAGMPVRKLALIAGSALGLVLMYALVQPYARARLTSFVDPWAHASSSGFQAVQGQIAIGSGGLFGVGPGQSVQKIFYLPEAPTDFILAVIGEELGVVGVFAVLFLYGLIAYAGLRAAKAARSLYSALIAVGVTGLIVSQAVLNAFAVLGLAPLTGVPLPLVSYGSSSMVVTLAAMGLLLNVAAGATGHVRALSPARGRADARSRTARRAVPAPAPARTTGGARGPPTTTTYARANRHDGTLMASAPRIVIAAGGTAGHVVPALAVADALRAEGAQSSSSAPIARRRELVPVAGYPLHTLALRGLDRANPLRALYALALAALATARARALLGRLAPDAVMGGGGYVAGPVALAALSMRVPLVLTEADSHLGLTNRLLAPFARRVCLAFPLAGRGGSRYRVTGRPIPPPAHDRAQARERFGIEQQETCVLVFGGSLGARSINLAAVEGLADAAVHVLHVSGVRDHSQLLARARRPGYDLREYLDVDAFADALAAADLVVARSGGSVFEIAAHGLPAILVPYPHAAADHQSANARWMEQAGAALTIPDVELNAERLRAAVDALLSDRERLAAMARASAQLARPQAARDVARELLEAAA